MQKKRIDVISLGCSKNLVESERLLKRLDAKGYKTVFDSDDPRGELVIVNTCGFISDAKEESINTILQLGMKKKKGLVGEIAVMGCLSQRYLEELKKELPEVDRWYGKFDWDRLADSLPDISNQNIKLKHWERKLTTPPHSAYLKISEGCNRFCAFCAIPLITGRHKSRPIEEIAEEVTSLVKEGVKEFNIIAQDLSSYGTDLYGKQSLARLLETLADIPGVKWLRLHYAYPSDFPLEVLEVMRNRENVCNYIDIALQHISDKVLSNMRRHITKEETLALLATIRQKVPDIKIRTTLMTGFPGEGEQEFQELMEFVTQQQFDRLGAFTYSEEDDTNAAKNLTDNIPQAIKEERLNKLMAAQQEIAQSLNDKLVGSIQKVLIDKVEGDFAYGRTQYDSPEVDPEVIIKTSGLQPGMFVDVKIIEAYPFELIGELYQYGNQG